jgi:hypothetical protein
VATYDEEQYQAALKMACHVKDRNDYRTAKSDGERWLIVQSPGRDQQGQGDRHVQPGQKALGDGER